MTDPSACGGCAPTPHAEIARLNKIIKALIDRAERSMTALGSDFNQFQTTIMLEEQVRSRTAELEAALRENERIEHSLRKSEAKFRGLVNQSLVGIAIMENGRLTYANPKFAEMFGYSLDETLHLSLLDIAATSNRDKVANQLGRRLSGEVDRVDYLFRGVRKNGAEIDVECHSSVMDNNGQPALITLLIDVTERLRAERKLQDLQNQLREQAIHDPLTGLYNRQPLAEFLGRELRLAQRQRQPVSAILADLDHFKAVNDTHGHLAGDEVLKAIGRLIKRHCRATDIFCRYGGEEFLIILPSITLELAAQRADLMRIALAAQPIAFGSARIHVTASFGIATFPQHGATQTDLIEAADRALYAAKEAGRNRVQAFCESTTGKGLHVPLTVHSQ